MTTRAKIGFIGGSGLYDLEGIQVIGEERVDTPFGEPSDAIVLADVGGETVAFLPRHGRGHRVLPSEVNSRANITALKMLGVEQVVAFSAVGSLQEDRRPLDFAVPEQLIDRTRHRPDTFFGDGIVGHVAFADPFCARLRTACTQQVKAAELPGGHEGDTLVCMEGPLFSTRAESHWYRSMGASLINMSAIPEAKLAREAELCYSVVCMVTDYDCWRGEDEDVDIQMVLDNLRKNADGARRLIRSLVEQLRGATRDCGCADACQYAVITARDHQPPEARRRLAAVLPRYFQDG